jgi:flagellar hook protein FlgE
VNFAKAQAAAASLAMTAAQAAQAAASLATVPGATLSATQLVFDTSGKLTTTMPLTISLDLAGVSTALGTTNSAATPLAFNLDFTGTSQYGSPFGVNALTQDGFSSGRLNGFNVGSDGVVQGRYSNGQSRSLGQIVLANFTNPNGLKPLGNNQWAETPDSNQPLIGTPGSGSLGVMQSAAVEESNVDLTAELVNMITAQRVYQANAQTIKTQDSIMQTIVNLR